MKINNKLIPDLLNLRQFSASVGFSNLLDVVIHTHKQTHTNIMKQKDMPHFPVYISLHIQTVLFIPPKVPTHSSINLPVSNLNVLKYNPISKEFLLSKQLLLPSPPYCLSAVGKQCIY